MLPIKPVRSVTTHPDNTNPGTSLVLGFAALLIVVSYTIIAVNFVVTLVESYLVVSAGFIFLGFGGSRWTAPYTERYIGLAVSIGIKIVLLYCLISAGFSFSLDWVAEAESIGASARPVMTAFDVMGGSLIFMMCCWQIPKLFAAVIGGAPALTGGDLVATAAAVGSAALAVGGAAVAAAGAAAGGAGGAAAGTGSAASAGGSGSGTTTAVASVGSVGTGSSAGGGSVPPPSSPSPGSIANGGGARRRPDPPSNGSGDGGAVDPPLARHSHGSVRPAARTRRADPPRCRRLGASRWWVPDSRRNRLSGASHLTRSARSAELLHPRRVLRLLPQP